MLIEQFKSKLSHYKYKIELGPVHWNWNSRSSRKLTSLRLQLMRRCRSRLQQIWYNVLGLYGSPLAFRVSNTKRHSQNCISERVSDPNSALNGFSPAWQKPAVPALGPLLPYSDCPVSLHLGFLGNSTSDCSGHSFIRLWRATYTGGRCTLNTSFAACSASGRCWHGW